MGVEVTVVTQKWIAKIDVDRPVSKVARAAAATRLTSVRKSFDLAAIRYQEDTEYIHQLRVSTRRATVALSVFEPLTPRRRGKRMRRMLREFRHAADDARDLDILVQAIEQRQWNISDTAQHDTLQMLHDLREQAQQEVGKCHRRRHQRFRSEAKKLRKQIRWKGAQSEPSYREFAAQAMGRAWTRFLRRANGDLQSSNDLHRLRIATKKLRYSIELVGVAFDAEVRSELYKSITDIQDRLGLVNDRVMADRRFRRWLQRSSTPQHALAELGNQQAGGLQAAVEQFRNWWNGSRLDQVKSAWACHASH